MTLIFIAIILSLFVLLASKNLELAFLAVCASLPLYVLRFTLFGIPFTLLEAMIIILFLVWLSESYYSLYERIRKKLLGEKHSESRRYPFDVEIVLVLIISFVAMIIGGLTNSAMGIWKAYFFESVLFFILFFNIFFGRKKSSDEPSAYSLDWPQKIILALSVGVFYVSVFAIYQKITGSFIPNELWAQSETRRVTGFYGYPNAIGLFLAPIFMLQVSSLVSLYVRFKNKCTDRQACAKWSIVSLDWFWKMPLAGKIHFTFLKLSAFLSLLAIYFAKSEGALIAVVAALLFALFFIRPFGQRSYLRRATFALLLLVMLLVLASPFRDNVLTRLRLDDFSGQIRKAQWAETGVYLRDNNWFWGAGLAGYQKAIAPYHREGIYIRNNDPDFERLVKIDPEYQKKHWQPLEIFLYPHNVFLNFWVELGILGLLVFVWIFFKFFYICFSLLGRETDLNKRLLIIGVLTAMLASLIHGIVDVPYFKNDLSVLFWLIVAMAGAMTLENNEKSTIEKC